MILPATSAPAQTAATGAAAAPQAAATKSAAAHSAAEQNTPPPKQLDLLPLLEASPQLRSDLLFFIRLCGTYCQSIFWQAFPRTAKKRRQRLFDLAQNGIPDSSGRRKPCGSAFKDAILIPKIRYAQTTDILNTGFIKLLQALAQTPAAKGQAKIYEIFSKGLVQRHGLPWNIDEFIAAVQLLVKMRHFLEHYDERIAKQDKIPAPQENAECLTVLGLLLLPQFCNELGHAAKHIKTNYAAAIIADMQSILQYAKEKRAEGIKAMFAEARARKNIYAPEAERTKSGGYKNKKQKSRELLSGKWRKYYYGLKLAPTDLRENRFKQYYDFIGEQNFRQICARLGAPLAMVNLQQFDPNNRRDKNFVIYAGTENRLSFKNEILPFYLTIMRLQKIIHFYSDNYAEKCLPLSPLQRRDMDKEQRKGAKKQIGRIKDPNLRAIRNQIAHNGLFWLTKNEETASLFSEQEIFTQIMQILTPQNPLIANSSFPRPAHFYNAVKAVLEAENCSITHIEKTATEPPGTIKLRRLSNKQKISGERLEKQRTARQNGKIEPRKALRFRLRQLILALEKAQDSLK
ncbi:MAG: hypothetical protein DU429_07830 [Candidatus Tokpelaia sp.]|nr:MAG: hypothetical protein DU430_08160 [Candidatus Tokpelaia sp.]KAA6205533.1 MAG: hypothetical protein DU429_07830 [Candidatus Tokpelaia sp.]